MARPFNIVQHIENRLAELKSQREQIMPEIRRLTKARKALEGLSITRTRRQKRKPRGTRTATGPRGDS